MILFVDADASPVTRDAVSVGRRHRIKVVLVGNESQSFERYANTSGVEVVQVGTGPDAADFAIIRMLSPEDVVVTADLGLAAMVLGRGARAVSPRGKIYSALTIDAELAVRHAEKQHRRAGGRTQGPPPFEPEDRERFKESLDSLLGESPRPTN